MRILSRYIVSQFLKYFAFSLITFLGLYLVIDVINTLDTLIHHRASPGPALRYFVWQLPSVVYLITPISVLIGIFFSIGFFARNNELTAVKSSGIPLMRWILPIFAACLAISVLNFINNEYLTPYANLEKDRVMTVSIKKKPLKPRFRNNNFWYRSEDAIYKIRGYFPAKKLLRGVTIFRFDPDFNLVARIDAPFAQWNEEDKDHESPEHWKFYNVTVREFLENKESTREYFDVKAIPIPETPESFSAIDYEAEQLSYRQLKAYIEKIRAEGSDASHFRVELYSKISTPIISFIIPFFAIPLAVRTGRARTGSFAIEVLLAVFLSFLFYGILAFAQEIGKSEEIHPLLAAWIANIIFASLGGFLLARMKQ